MSSEQPERRPTLTAQTAKAFMDAIDKKAYQDAISNRAVLSGWVGARGAGLWDAHVSDTVAEAAVGGVLDLFRQWASECDEDVPDQAG